MAMPTMRLAAVAVSGALLAGCQDGAALTSASRELEEAAAAQSSLVGQQAPDFTLRDQGNEPVALRDQRGKWLVLYFYRDEDTPACACQAASLAKGPPAGE
jgi:cytochrome oxidase Cu insertion factor (SCO1/SenC/PrrC family)